MVKVNNLGAAKPDSDFWKQDYTINLVPGKPAKKPAEKFARAREEGRWVAPASRIASLQNFRLSQQLASALTSTPPSVPLFLYLIPCATGCCPRPSQRKASRLLLA